MNRDSPFQSKLVPGKPGSGRLFDEELTVQDGPVTCLGMTFANDAERRVYFTEQLRKKLKDTEFREIEGFPIGIGRRHSRAFRSAILHGVSESLALRLHQGMGGGKA